MKRNAETFFLAAFLILSVFSIRTVRGISDRRATAVMAQSGSRTVQSNISLRDYAEERYERRFS